MKENRMLRGAMFLVLGLALVLVVGQLAHSQDVPEPPKGDAAQEALQVYIEQFVTEENFAAYGFKDLKEAQAAKVAEPYAVMFISLEDLKGYKPGTGAMPILQDARIYWYAVTANGNTRTKLEMAQVNGEWIPGEFGGVSTVQEVVTARISLERHIESGRLEARPDQVVVVKIPALIATFLYFESAEEEYFIPAMVQAERFRLEKGTLYTTDEVLSILSRIAQPIDGSKAD